MSIPSKDNGLGIFKDDCSGGCPKSWELFKLNPYNASPDSDNPGALALGSYISILSIERNQILGIDWGTVDYEAHFGKQGVSGTQLQICRPDGACTATDFDFAANNSLYPQVAGTFESVDLVGRSVKSWYYGFISSLTSVWKLIGSWVVTH